MIIVMRHRASSEAVQRVIAEIRACGLQEHLSEGVERTIIGVVGDERRFEDARFAALPEVERAVRILHDWQIISREARAEDTVITVRGVSFGGTEKVRLLARPTQDFRQPEQAQAIFLDPYFTSSRPYEALHAPSEKENAAAAKRAIAHWHEAGLPVMVRIRDTRHIEPTLAADADMLYLGGELPDNAALAREIGRLNTPLVLCKDKHHNSTDWLRAAERVALHGNHHLILGDAGTLNLDQTITTRLDCEAIAIARTLSHLPILANLTALSNPYQNTAMLSAMAYAAGANALIMRDETT
ncbi:MAG: chorismate mutase [Neisseria sp.]|nr:chorismate mutase [Neisseria sp.]